MNSWIKDHFKTQKPVVAMAHLPGLPGTPRYDESCGIYNMVEKIRPDVEHLVQGGVDAIMFCNEDDRPYVLQAGIEQIAAMTRVVTELAPRTIPFGVDFLWDPFAALAIAHATGASFIREVLTGMYESDMGMWSPNAGEVFRFRRKIGAANIRMFFNIVPEFASSMGSRNIAQRAKSVVVSCLPDVILASGPMAGSEPDITTLREIKEAIGDIPVFVNTGANEENIKDFLSIADGVIVGSSLKVDGYTWNPIDPSRVARFMAAVQRTRQMLLV
jgi:membrane complex biogenesis BtpA family protein